MSEAVGPGAPERSAWQRAGIAAAVLAIAAAGIGVAARSLLSSTPPSRPADSASSEEALAGFAEGWTEMAIPPEVRSGATVVWSGTELLSWGGCDPATHDHCVPTSDGYAFDPSSRQWRQMPAAPNAGAFADAARIGDEVVFILSGQDSGLVAQAFDHVRRSWRVLAPPPDPPGAGAVQVWTGTHLLVWGGGRPGGEVAPTGALYDPLSNSWQRILEAPIGLNAASGLWTGEEVLVFGSLLDGRNWARTDTSVGAAYNPSTQTWRELPPSDLSPQATSAVWIDDRMLAWDYEGPYSQEYWPERDTWSEPVKMPLEFSECYPDSVVAGRTVFAFFCGQAALYDIDRGRWLEATGGPLDVEIWSKAYDRRVKVWRFAHMAPAGDVVFFAAQGLTLDRKGEACYGCEGSPTSFWAYRPPAR